LHRQLDEGVPAESLDDARRIARELPVAHRRPTSLPGYVDTGRTLTVGTCLRTDETGVSVTSCQELHNGEVYAIVRTPYSRFPGSAALHDFVRFVGPGLVKPYLGIQLDSSKLRYETLQPDADAWEQAGSRAVACLLQPALVTETSRSLHGSRQIFEDDFSDQTYWPIHDDVNCTKGYSAAAELSLEKKEGATFCVSTPDPAGVEPSLVHDAQTSIDAGVLQWW
jgi:hypothetical protein